MKKKLILLLLLFCNQLFAADIVTYSLSFSEPQAHYVDVEMLLENWKGGDVEVSMPVWAPGSYLVREFSRMVESVKANDPMSKREFPVEKLNKNTWRVKAGKAATVRLSYRVYAFELTVRTSFVDEEHAYLNGTSIFMSVKGRENNEHQVHIQPAAAWKTISVALDRLKANDPWKVKAENYDMLVDAPFEIGNHLVFNFTAAGVPHEVAMVGEGNYDVERLKKDMTKVVEECTRIFGEHPCQRYVFIVHNLTSGGGGLEHLNSTTLQTNRWSYTSESAYAGFMSLVAHEYFHLWNVKRLRPQPLGPFNYNSENYTSLLWIAEGFTAYYDDLIAKRCGFYSEKEYLKTLAGNFSYAMNIKGAPFQSLSESSFDAWIKFYRSHENSNNSSVSYYTKGGVMGALLDLMIRNATGGNKSLDHVFSEMYQLYFKKLSRGYTESEFIQMVNKVAGRDFSSFFKDYINDVKVFPLADLTKESGLVLKDLNAGQIIPYLGINTNFTGGKLMVTSIDRGSAAWNAGVNVNDELLAVDHYRVTDDLTKLIAARKPGDKIELLVSRAGFIKKINLTVEGSPFVKYALEWEAERSPQQKKNTTGWLESTVN